MKEGKEEGTEREREGGRDMCRAAKNDVLLGCFGACTAKSG